MAEPVKDGLYRDPTSGAVVTVRGGKVVLQRGGELAAFEPHQVGTAILSGDYAPASAEDFAKHAAAQRKGGALEALGTAAEHAATGVYGGLTAVPRALGGAAEVIAKKAGAPMQGPGVAALSEEALAEGIAGGIAGSPEAGKRYSAERAERAAAHPAAALGGALIGQTVGGAMAPVAAAGNAGTVTKTIAGALEGASMGGAQAHEEAYVQKTDLTSEKLVASMGPMALLGGGAALLGAGASRLFSRSGSRAEAVLDSPRLTAAAEPGPAGFRKMLAEFAEERTTKALGARGSDIRKMGRTAEAAEANMRKMSRDVLEGTLDDGTKIFKPLQSQDDLVQNVMRARDESAAKLEAFRSKVWKHAEETGGYRSNAKLVDMDAFYAKVEKEVLEPLRGSGVAEVAAKAGAVENKLAEIRSLGGNPSLPQLSKYRQDLASIVYPKPTAPGLAPLPPLAMQELQAVERNLEHVIEAATDKVAATMPGAKAEQYVTLKSKFRSFNQAAQIAGKADLQDLGNRVVSPSDYLTAGAGAIIGGMAGGGLGAAVTGAVTGAVHKTVREHSSAVLAVLADRLSRNVDLRIDTAIGKVLSKAELPALGPVGGKLRTAANVAFAKKDEDKRDAFVRHARDIYAATNPATSTAKMAQSFGPLYSHAPQLGQAATATSQRAAAYLASKIPAAAVSVNVFSPAKMETNISDEDLHKFATAWTTVNNPLSILDDLQKNMLTAEQVEAVKVVYPELFQQLQFKVREALTRQKEPPPYSTRLQLDLLLDLNGAGEPSLAPTFQRTLMNISQIMQQGQQQSQPRQPTAPSSMAGQLRTLSGGIAAGQG
jgi:hypothetical protein